MKTTSKYTLNPERADDGSIRKQDQWIEWHNSNGSIMASASDVYQASSGSEDLLDDLRTDFNEGLLTSTRVKYNKLNEKAKITQYFSSQHTEPKKNKKIQVPDYDSNVPLETLLSTPQGLNFAQSLLDTEDSPKEIVQNLETLSGMQSKNIYFWTSSQIFRQAVPRVPVTFMYEDNKFFVALGNKEGGGISRSMVETA